MYVATLRRKARRPVTLLLFIDFFVVLVTGILMIQFLRGYLPKATVDVISKIHTISGIVMGILTILHMWVEFRVLVKLLFGK